MAVYSDRTSLGTLVHPHAIKGVDEWMSQIVASRAFEEEEARRRRVSGLADRASSDEEKLVSAAPSFLGKGPTGL